MSPQKYKEIPSDATKLYLDIWTCGDDCDCSQASIIAQRSKKEVFFGKLTPIWETLWEGTYGCELWYNGEYNGEFKKEIIAACEHYGITPDLSSDLWYGDWNGERIL